MTGYVAYYRVSTARQGRSGLGLAAQKAAVDRFLSAGDAVLAEFIEVQSGRQDNREQLWKAIEHARRHQAKILIAKLDRFSRRVSFIARLMDEGVHLVVAELPNANEFQLHIFAALAQEERRLISERTRHALAEAKRRGTELGKHGRVLAARRQDEAQRFAESLRGTVAPMLRETGNFSEIARRLNSLGVRSYKGARFHPQTVKDLVRRIMA